MADIAKGGAERYFCDGAPAAGLLPALGAGLPQVPGEPASIIDLWDNRAKANAKLFKGMRPDENAAFLMEQMSSDAHVGWMTAPRRMIEKDLNNALFAKGFSVEQGSRSLWGLYSAAACWVGF